MVKKQVCSIVHEAYAREKGEVFIWEARAVSHPGINFIPERFNNRTVPKKGVGEFLSLLYRKCTGH